MPLPLARKLRGAVARLEAAQQAVDSATSAVSSLREMLAPLTLTDLPRDDEEELLP